MRLFIAAEIPAGVRDRIEDIQNRLRPFDLDAKWVEPRNMHLTLKFLGEIAESRLEELDRKLREIAGRHERFRLSLGGLGLFPGAKSPRVLWAGLTEGAAPLKALAAALEKGLEPLGFPREERPFKAHLTLARIRSARSADRLAHEVEIERGTQIGGVPVDEVLLIRSVLRRDGPTYTVLERFPLASLTCPAQQ